jgi:hypothetical protein
MLSPEMQVASSSNGIQNTSRWDNPTRPESFRLPKQPCRTPRQLLSDHADHCPRSPRRTYTPDPVDGCVRRPPSPNSMHDHFAQDQDVKFERSPRKPVRTVSTDGEALFFGGACGAALERTTAAAATTTKKTTHSRKGSRSLQRSSPHLPECV